MWKMVPWKMMVMIMVDDVRMPASASVGEVVWGHSAHGHRHRNLDKEPTWQQSLSGVV